MDCCFFGSTPSSLGFRASSGDYGSSAGAIKGDAKSLETT